MASSGTIGKINAGGNDYLVASTAFATCDTAANTDSKVVTIQDSASFTLIEGITIHVYFSNGNTAVSPTLNVNNTGAKSIYGLEEWTTGGIFTFTYHNQIWYCQGLNEIVPLSKGGTGIDAGDNNVNWYNSSTLHPQFHVLFDPELGSFRVVYRGPLDGITTISDFTQSDYFHAAIRSVVPIWAYSINFIVMGTGIATPGMLYEDSDNLYILFPDAIVFNGTYVNGLKGQLVYDANDGIYINPSTLLPSTPAWLSATVQDVTVNGSSVVSSGTAELYTGTSSGTLAAGDHGHGNISNSGDIAIMATISNGDRLVIHDASNSDICNSSITFGTSQTQFLANDGTWQTPATGGSVDSTDTSNKIFLIGAETQGTGVSTYSDNQVYATSGQLDMNKARIAEHVTMQYNSTTEALDFVFA